MTKLKKSLYINISNVLSFPNDQSEKIPLDCEIEGFESPDLLSGDRAKIKSFIKATKIEEKILLEIAGDFETVISCSRCLNPVPIHCQFSADAIASFIPREDELKIDGDRIDIHLFLGQTIILALPTKVLCRDNCRGLCPVCGIDRNIQQCRCKNEISSNSFEKLKALKIKKNGRTKKEK